MSADILKIYPWINETFLLNKIKNIESNNVSIEIKSFDAEYALGNGENFCSDIIRIVVKYTLNNSNAEKSIHFILKASMPNKDFDEVENSYDFFYREIEVYRRILPEVQSLLRSVGDLKKLAPICYKCGEDNPFLLFEDLRMTGYKNVDKSLGLNFEQLKLGLTTLAKWHAATATLGVTNSSILKDHLKPCIRSDVPVTEVLQTNIILALTHQMENWPNYEPIHKRLLSIKDKFYKRICEDFVYKEDDFNVITHGDTWANNFMYKFDENGHPIDVLLIDFSIGCWGIPGKDLTYLLFSSSHKDVKEYEWDKLLQHYHAKLSAALRKFNYPRRIPSLTDIHISFLKGGLNSVFVALLIIGLRHIKDSDVKGFMPLISSDESDVQYRNDIFANPDCEASVKFILDYADRKGFFDI